jgi:hypothetical protein
MLSPFFVAAKRRVYAKVLKQIQSGYIDYRELVNCVPRKDLTPLPFFPPWAMFGPDSNLRAVLGGTQAVWAYIKDFQVDPQRHLVRYILGMKVGDVFGCGATTSIFWASSPSGCSSITTGTPPS